MIYLLSHAINEAVCRSPHHAAFRCRGESLSYAQLNDQANALASALERTGLRRGDRAAILLKKSLQVPVAVYACLRAGFIYVPIDTTVPPDRLEFLLADAGVSAILTSGNHYAPLSAICPRLPQTPKIVVGPRQTVPGAQLTVSWDEITPVTSFREPTLVESDPAYIIYTYGSTGDPKGILHTHRSGLSYAQLALETYGVCGSDLLGKFAPLHFDQSTFDYFTGPLAGATTILIPEEVTRFPASLAKLIDDERLTIWYSVPFAFIQLLLRGGLELRKLSSLRWVLYGGEAFPIQHLRDLMCRLPQARFSNVYGPAEVNQCTFYHIPEPPLDLHATVPLGQVWKNTESLIVDEQAQPVIAGEIGELLIRSATMMAGYWNRPDLDARCFLTIDRAGIQCKYYRTGDLVREDEQGMLQFHGRKDRQIKIRSHRVELDEVESAVRLFPGIVEAAAYSLPDPLTGDRQIALAIVSYTDCEIVDVGAGLASKLPVYAIPSQIYNTTRFPQTTT